jgi:hypothetical protein
MNVIDLTSTGRNVRLRASLLDEHNHMVCGLNSFAVKVSGLTLKSNNKVVIFNVIDGYVYFNFTLPDYYKTGVHSMILSTGTRAAYNPMRALLNLTLRV